MTAQTHTPELLNGDMLEALAQHALSSWQQADVKTGQGELNLVAAITQGVLTDLYSFGSDLRNYYNLGKKEKGLVIDSIFFQVLGLEGRASTKNPEGYTDTWNVKLNKLMPLIVYMVQRSLFVGVESMNDRGSQVFTIPAFLAGKDSLNGIDHVVTNDLAFGKSMCKKHFDERKVKNSNTNNATSSSPNDADNTAKETISLDTLTAQAIDGNIDYETTLDIINHVAMIIESLPNNMSDELHTAIATLTMICNAKLKDASVKDAA